MDPQSYLSAIDFPPIFYTFFPFLWPTGAGCSQMPVQGDPPQLWVFAQALGCSQSYLGLVKAEELRGAEHLTDSVKTAFLSLSLMKMSFRVPSHTQVCCSCLQKRKILKCAYIHAGQTVLRQKLNWSFQKLTPADQNKY